MPHIMIVVSPYYDEVAEHLLTGAKAALDEAHATYEVFDVAGAFEIPTAIKMGSLREEKRSTDHREFDGFLALGCVIRGETAHYDIVSNESARGLTQLSLDYNLLIGNAILTCDTHEQAVIRANPAEKNKGADAVAAVLSLLNLKRALYSK
ncbi:MAG: 6,7-dimethyl-8-ribityllumazine synthase [Alphaproteobacteria bacterium]|nr:MAG: 6,7-dimethyl-8-ribityllumazine synthase [Alphaproteobacteria bacterium]